jgi:predicted nucleic acid-binding protein
MISAVDTSVLLDVLTDDPRFGESSASALAEATQAGRLVVSEIVYAELAAAFRGDRESLDGFLADLGVALIPSTRTVLAEAGRLWRAQRDAGGSRRRLVADFLIAAHARETADHLISRDRGFFRQWFDDLDVIDPSGG